MREVFIRGSHSSHPANMKNSKGILHLCHFSSNKRHLLCMYGSIWYRYLGADKEKKTMGGIVLSYKKGIRWEGLWKRIHNCHLQSCLLLKKSASVYQLLPCLMPCTPELHEFRLPLQCRTPRMSIWPHLYFIVLAKQIICKTLIKIFPNTF